MRTGGERSRVVDLAWLSVLRVAAGLSASALAIALLARVPPLDAFLAADRHYPYRNLEWLKPLPPGGLRALAVVLAVAGAAMAAGVRYRLAAIACAAITAYFFFLDCLYYESTAYLGVLLLALLAVSPSPESRRGDRLFLTLFRFQVGSVYVFSAVSKWDADWLDGSALASMCPDYAPARWLAGIVPERDVFALASWAGMTFDLAIVPLLLLRRVRWAAFGALVLFHVHNALALSLGFVPVIVLVASTVFLPPDWPRKVGLVRSTASRRASRLVPSWGRAFVGLWMLVQIAIPMRRWLEPGDVYFHELGFPFSWAMRTRCKASASQLVIVEPASGRRELVPVAGDLSPWLATRAAGNPYVLWWSAKDVARERRDVEVHANAWVSLNGRKATPLVDPSIDLARQEFDRFGVPSWVTRKAAGSDGR